MKTLAEIRDGLAEEYFPTAGSGAFAHLYTLGFDAGAKAVMEQAQKLYDRLDQLYKDKYTNQHDIAALEEWQEFVGSQK